jgi:hypothetical protein
MVRRFAGLWIPAELLQVQDLTLHEIFLAAEIDALDHPRTGCTAKNEHFRELMGLGETRIKEIIAGLDAKGLIRYEQGWGKRRILRSCLAKWVADRRAEADRAIATFTAEVDAAASELGVTHPVEIIPSNSHRPGNRPDRGRDSGRTPNSVLMLRDNNESTKKESFGVTPNVQPPTDRVVITTTPTKPPKGRVGRPAKTGLVTAPLFGADPAGDYGPSDDEIYWAYPRKTKRPEGIKQIVLAVRRITIDHRARGIEFPEKSAREFLLQKVKSYAEDRRAELLHDPRALEFTPYPSTWFYNERYNDDESSGPIGRISPRRNAQRKTAEERGQFAESRDYSRIIHDTSGIDRGNSSKPAAGGGNGQSPSGDRANGENGGGGGVPSDQRGYRIGAGNAAAERSAQTENPPPNYGGIQ